MDTHCDEQKVERFLKHTLDFLYARTILDLLNDVVKENCYGCEVDDPSQVHHTCLMWTQIEHLYIYFDLVYDKIKYDDIVVKFRKEVEMMDITLGYKNSILDQFEDWYNEHEPKSETVQRIAERLLLLQNRFCDE